MAANSDRLPPAAAAGGVQLRLLTAQEVLEARREATALAGEDRDRALCSNACLVARAVVRRGRPVYGSGEEVLHRLTVARWKLWPAGGWRFTRRRVWGPDWRGAGWTS